VTGRRAGAVLLAAITLAACSGPGGSAPPMARTLPSDASLPATGVMPPDKVPKSQAAVVAQRVANTELTIIYSRPVARGRVLFGGIVPYGAEWNPGADQATALAITRDVRLEGHAVTAGKYSLWMIPRPDVWTVIFSRAADVYHTPYPGAAQDALRFDVPPRTGPPTETLTFEFPLVEGKDAELDLRWGRVILPLRITVP
jgi:hypothetical protein